MNNSIKTKSVISTLCSPLVIAGVLLHSSMAMADVTLTCTTAPGTNCSAPIPDNDPVGVDSTITVPTGSCAAGTEISKVEVNLEISHTWVGDLSATLVAPNATQSVLLERPGAPALGAFGCSSNDVDALFVDTAATPAEDQCEAVSPAITGTVSPFTPTAAFNTVAGDGVWTLKITDSAGGDVGNLNDWTLDITCAPDTTDPMITAPPDVTEESTGNLTSVTLGTATATDNADPAPAITNDSPGLFQLGETTVTWTAEDDAGNMATDTQLVTILPCNDFTNLICVQQHIIVKNETRFCDAYTYNPATGGYWFTTLFGLTQNIQPDDYLTDLIESRCGMPPAAP